MSLSDSAYCAEASGIDLQVIGLSKVYRSEGNEAPALDAVTFNVRRGERVAVIGQNGAGKTTLLRCCVRLIQPNSGEIWVLGKKINKLGPSALRKLRSRIGFVFQHHNLVQQLSAISNVLHGALARSNSPLLWYEPVASPEARELAYHYLEQVGAKDFAYKRVARLSGGQIQRVAIARMLMQEPDIIFADEPTASLDLRSGESIMQLLTDVSRRRNLAFIFVTHNIVHALGYSQRIVGLKEGHLVLDSRSETETLGSLTEVFQSDVNAKE